MQRHGISTANEISSEENSIKFITCFHNLNHSEYAFHLCILPILIPNRTKQMIWCACCHDMHSFYYTNSFFKHINNMRCLLLTFKQYTAKTYRNYVSIVVNFVRRMVGRERKGEWKWEMLVRWRMWEKEI